MNPPTVESEVAKLKAPPRLGMEWGDSAKGNRYSHHSRPVFRPRGGAKKQKIEHDNTIHQACAAKETFDYENNTMLISTGGADITMDIKPPREHLEALEGGGAGNNVAAECIQSTNYTVVSTSEEKPPLEGTLNRTTELIF